ncbi:DUF317 domain-containing protein [Streptomyces griseoviridis]
MPLSERQLVAFADKHATQITLDTSPRHLAGPGDARHVTHGLAAAGWRAISDPLCAEIVLRSPDLRHRLRFDPQSPSSAWWWLLAEPSDTEPGWYASFGEFVPAEVLATLADALVVPAPTELTSPLSVLDAAGWRVDGSGVAHSDPPGSKIERQPQDGSNTVAWHVDVRDGPSGLDNGKHLWHAYFHGHTPEHLVNAFITALTDTAPLQRGLFDRTATYGVTHGPSTVSPQQTVAMHTARIKALRAQARSLRGHQNRAASTSSNAANSHPAPRR